MKVTIVIPLYNKVDQIEMSVVSAVRQTYQDIEIIVVDDGSTDGSSDVVAKICLRYPKIVLKHQKNQGLSVARNTGLKASCGDYVLFHDADDELEENAVAKLVAVALRYPSDIVGGVFRRHTPKHQAVLSSFNRNEYQMDFRSDVVMAQSYCLNFSSCNKIFRVEFLKKNELRFTPGLYMQDIEFWLRCMFAASSVSQTTTVVSNYYHYPDSQSQSRTPARFESLFKLCDRISGFFERKELQDFAFIGSYALMQGAFRFFVNWKLDEWKRGTGVEDLDRIAHVLRKIPEQHFVSFLKINRGPTAPLLLLIREGDYEEAHRLKKTPYSGSIAWRSVIGNLNNARKITAFSKGVGRSRFRNFLYEAYYLAPFYFKNPRSLLTGIWRRVSKWKIYTMSLCFVGYWVSVRLLW